MKKILLVLTLFLASCGPTITSPPVVPVPPIVNPSPPVVVPPVIVPEPPIIPTPPVNPQPPVIVPEPPIIPPLTETLPPEFERLDILNSCSIHPRKDTLIPGRYWLYSGKNCPYVVVKWFTSLTAEHSSQYLGLVGLGNEVYIDTTSPLPNTPTTMYLQYAPVGDSDPVFDAGKVFVPLFKVKITSTFLPSPPVVTPPVVTPPPPVSALADSSFTVDGVMTYNDISYTGNIATFGSQTTYVVDILSGNTLRNFPVPDGGVISSENSGYAIFADGGFYRLSDMHKFPGIFSQQLLNKIVRIGNYLYFSHIGISEAYRFDLTTETFTKLPVYGAISSFAPDYALTLTGEITDYSGNKLKPESDYSFLSSDGKYLADYEKGLCNFEQTTCIRTLGSKVKGMNYPWYFTGDNTVSNFETGYSAQIEGDNVKQMFVYNNKVFVTTKNSYLYEAYPQVKNLGRAGIYDAGSTLIGNTLIMGSSTIGHTDFYRINLDKY